jgi:N-acetylglucosaminyldiphosphoundecaprenol N-acetyl-beta-D-mannosaminyltransferase
MKEATSGPFETCGVRVDLHPLAGAQTELERLAASGRGADVHLCNTYTLTLARQVPALAAVLNAADLNLPDGVPVLWAAQLAGQPRPEHGVRGPDLFNEAIFGDWGSRYDHYLFGGSQDTLDAILARASAAGTKDRIVGAESPPFRELNEKDYSEAAERIMHSGAHFVWVGLGTPKQDYASSELKRHVNATFLAVGAAFDFAAGNKPEAPRFLRHSGWEWLFRLATEPRRLWKRYLGGNARFAVELYRQWRRRGEG